MTKPLVIFGTGDIAPLAHYYFTHDSPREVVAFCVNRDYLEAETFCDLPAVAFEDLTSRYEPGAYDLFIALSYSKLNAVRRKIFDESRACGYQLASYISSRATVLNDGKIGANCFILEDNTIQPFVTIGDNVTLWSGNHIGHHSSIGDHCFIASQVVVSGGVEIGEQCFIGVNATLRDHIVIGDRCVIGAGAILLEDAAVYMGSKTERARVPSTRLKGL